MKKRSMRLYTAEFEGHTYKVKALSDSLAARSVLNYSGLSEAPGEYQITVIDEEGRQYGYYFTVKILTQVRQGSLPKVRPFGQPVFLGGHQEKVGAA